MHPLGWLKATKMTLTPENYQDTKEYNAFMELFNELGSGPRPILSYELFIALYEFSVHFIKKFKHDTKELVIRNSEDLLWLIHLTDLFDHNPNHDSEIKRHALNEIKRYLRFELSGRDVFPIYDGFNNDRPFNIKRRIMFVILEYILAEIFEFLVNNGNDEFKTLNDLSEILSKDEELNSIFQVLKVDKAR